MTTPRPLDGQVALITGAGSGLGAAFARRLHADGATVIVNDLSADAASAVAISVDGDVAVFDVADAEAFDTEVDKAVERHGRLDIVINNAGIAPPSDPDRTQRSIANQMLRMEGRVADMTPPDSLVSMTDADWDRMIRVHLYGTFHGTRAALRHMTPARRGAVVNVSSVLGLRPMAGVAHYAAAKAGIIALTKSAGQEVAPFGVRVNAVCPGWIDTPLLAPLDPITRGAITMQIPHGRMGTAEEIAELVRFLCGPESSYCNGDIFAASGGFT
ncbi:MAG: SDR family NAD(P)-dependent oxidoreductase [Ilumatobacteraceae bacterium]|jgi:3-oxoacyl-[acyl-carrier protein] reductase